MLSGSITKTISIPLMIMNVLQALFNIIDMKACDPGNGIAAGPVSATAATFLFMCVSWSIWVYLLFPLMPHLTFRYLVWPIGRILSIITLLFIFPATKKLKQNAPAAND